MIYTKIDELINYAIDAELISESDKIYVRNRLLTKLGLDDYEVTDSCDKSNTLEEILDAITDYAAENGLLENNSIVYRDIFDTEIMDTVTPFPSTVIEKFNSLYEKSPKQATDYFYKLSCDSNYI